MGEETLKPVQPNDIDDTRELREEELRQIQAGAKPATGTAREEGQKRDG